MESQEQIKFICNNTGKGNFKQKLEDLKLFVVPKSPPSGNGKKVEEKTEKPEESNSGNNKVKEEAEQNLAWFIHYILTKRISGQNQTLHHIYIELIKQIGVDDATPKTIRIAMEILKKCMLIDEDDFNQVANRPPGQQHQNLIKQYLGTLGSFIGSLTLAANRPILSKEIDFKQLLIQGF